MRRLILTGFGLSLLLVIVAAVGSGFLFSQTAQRTTTAEERYSRGMALYKKWECAEAIAEFDKAIT